MSQLACPLCGRYVSLSRFDPSGFDNDIYAVNMVGLGRGKGFAVGPSFSVLNDVTITGAIASRCRIILGLIDGVDAQSNEVSILRAEIEKFKAEAFRKERVQQDLYTQLADLERQVIYWKNEVTRLQRVQKESRARAREAEVDKLKWMVERLQNENRRLESLRSEMEDDVDNEGELLAMEEMETILDRINASANTDFEYLDDAVSYLLEGN